MQQPISRREVYEPSLTATIGGHKVKATSISMDRELPDPLTGQALRAASGTVTAVDGPVVSEKVATPWDPSTSWPPGPEDPASAQMGTGQGEVSILAGGRVIHGEGGTSGRAVSVEVADRYQTLDRSISWDALADAMPSETDGVQARYVGLRATALTDRILRHCGWYATPPRLPFCVTSVPAMGTMWPEVGVCRTSGSQTTGGYPGFFTEAWGSGVTNVSAEYATFGNYSIKSRGRMELTAVAGRTNGGTMRIEAIPAGGGLVRLAWTDSTASVWVSDPADATVSVVSLPRAVGSMLYATVSYASDTSVSVTLRVGAQSATSTATVRSTVTTGIVGTVRINGDGVGGGFQVAFPSTPGSLTGWTPNAVIYDRTSSANSLYVFPSVEGENCARLLDEQCKAQNATYWIDETGVLRWWDLARLEAQPVIATLTSRKDITEDGFRWEHSLASVKSRALVQWKEPLREWSWWRSIDLWRGSGKTIQSGDAPASAPSQEWINTPNDEVWIMPDLSLNRVPGTELTDFNYGIGSHYGAVTRTAEGADRYAQLSGTFTVTVEKVTGSGFKMSTVWVGTDQAVMRAPDEESISELWKGRRGAALPILRGKAKFTLTDRITYSAQSGPESAPEHAIDAGWWIQRPEQAQHTADYAGARLTIRQPVISSASLVPIPGLQLGDMVEAVVRGPVSLTVRGLIEADSRAIREGMAMQHAVTIRPVQVSRDGVTWEEWGRVMAGRTWQTWGEQQAGKTWEQWGQDPLAGEDL